MSEYNDHDQEIVPDLEALSRAYEQSLRDVSFGDKDIPLSRTKKKRPAPTGELKDFVPTDMHKRKRESSAEHDRVVDKIKRDRKKFSHSVWTDEPVLKPKKSIWIDDTTQQYDKSEFNAALKEARQNQAPRRAAEPAPVRRQPQQPQPAQMQQRPAPKKKSEPLILAMAEPEQPQRREPARRNAPPQQRRNPQQPIRPILDEKPKKQEFVMRMGQDGVSRVREIPRQPNKKQVMMQMSRETFEEYERNGINNDPSVRRTVNISMPISKMLPDEPEKEIEKQQEVKAEVKPEVKTETKPKPSVNAKSIVDDIAEQIVGKKSVKIVDDIEKEIVGSNKNVPAEETPAKDITSMSLDEIIKETKAAAELEKERAAKAKAVVETAPESETKAEGKPVKTDTAKEKAKEGPEEKKADSKPQAPVKAEKNEGIDEIKDSFYEKTEELDTEEVAKAAAESAKKPLDETEVSPKAADSVKLTKKAVKPDSEAIPAAEKPAGTVKAPAKAAAGASVAGAAAMTRRSGTAKKKGVPKKRPAAKPKAEEEEESYDFSGLINKVKNQRANNPLSESVSVMSANDEDMPVIRSEVYEEPAPKKRVLKSELEGFDRPAPKKKVQAGGPETFERAVPRQRTQAKKPVKRRKKPKYHESEFSFINSIMCIALVFAIFLSLLLMKRESGFISSENRNLATFPKFTADNYLSGQYTKDITEYFTDTIPGRESFKKFGSFFGKNLGINLDDTVVTGNHKVAEKEEIDREKLATTTTVTINTDITEPTSADTKKADGKAATTTSATTTTKKTSSEEVVELPEDLDDGAWEGDVIVFGKGKDVRAVAGYYGLFGTGALYAETINKWKEELPNVNVYNMSIPNASAYYLPDSFKDTVSSQKDNIENIGSELKGIINVDVYDTLDKHKKEYIYSRTDHHWQPLGAYYAGKVFAEKASIDYPDIKFYEECKIEGFLGTMYAYSNYDSELANNPDTFIYYKPDNDYTVRYYDTDFTGGLDSTLFFDGAEGVNCYSAILGRDEEITEIETDVDNHRVLVIFKDSYGNALIPFLTHGFEKIYVCDFRYFDCNAIDFCKRVGCTDLLFAISLQSCSTEMHITALNNDRIQLDPSVAATSETTTLYNFDKPDESGTETAEGEGEDETTTTTQPYDTGEVYEDPNAYNYEY